MLLKMHEAGAVTWVPHLNQFCVIMDLSKYGYWVVEMKNAFCFSKKWKKDCTAHSVRGSVVTWNQMTGFHYTAIIRTVLKEEHIPMFFGWMCTEMVLLNSDQRSQTPFSPWTQENIRCPFCCNETEKVLVHWIKFIRCFFVFMIIYSTVTFCVCVCVSWTGRSIIELLLSLLL